MSKSEPTLFDTFERVLLPFTNKFPIYYCCILSCPTNNLLDIKFTREIVGFQQFQEAKQLCCCEFCSGVDSNSTLSLDFCSVQLSVCSKIGNIATPSCYPTHSLGSRARSSAKKLPAQQKKRANPNGPFDYNIMDESIYYQFFENFSDTCPTSGNVTMTTT